MNGFATEKEVEALRAEYKPNDRVRLIEMRDEFRDMPAGLEGNVMHVDDAGTIHVRWDNGSGLGVVFGVDKIEKIGGGENDGDKAK